MVVGLIGPTNLREAAAGMGRSRRFFERAAVRIGRAIAESGHDLWVNAETRGMPVLVGKSYKRHGGARLVVLLPGNGSPWPAPKKFALRGAADEVRHEPSWFWANWRVASIPDIVVCAGRSTGVDSELGYLKWNIIHKVERPRCLVVLKNLARLEPHQITPLAPLLTFLTIGELREALRLL